MKPVVVNGEIWQVNRVNPDDPALIDRTGIIRVATTDPDTMVISIADNIMPPLFDKVLLHEVAHAATVSYGLLDELRWYVEEGDIIPVEEWAARFVEDHSMAIIVAASESLGRPLCIGGICLPNSW